MRRRRRGNRIVPPRSDAFRAPVRAATLHCVPRMCRPHRGRAIPRRRRAPLPGTIVTRAAVFVREFEGQIEGRE